jgi:hypothetical protein
VRLDGQRAGERHPLALAAGELARVALAEVREAHEVQQLLHAGAARVLGALADGQAEADVVGHRHVLEGGVVLEHEADLAALRRVVGDLLVADDHGAGVGLLEPRDHAQQRRLAAAGRAEQRGQRAVGHGDADVVEREELAVALRHVAGFDTHQISLCRRWIKVMRVSTATAISASTSAAA